jgi:hypothetical protein
MATIVLVHGIDNQREGPDLIKAAWLLALAGSVRLAGREDLADRLLLPRSQPDAIDSRAVYYGDLFRSPDLMGDGFDLRDLTQEQATLAGALALAYLERIAESAPAESADTAQARSTLEILRDPEKAGAQGAGNVLREAIRTLSRISWLATIGMSVAEFLKPSMVQVGRYLTDGETRSQAKAAVSKWIDAKTRVVVGHSLGSVVAYECAHELSDPLPLLVTIGSPLGLSTIVTQRLRPPPSFPAKVAVWLNLANREDVVAAEPDLRPLFAHDLPASSRFEGVRFDEPCSDPHRAETYLGRIAVGRAVIPALA